METLLGAARFAFFRRALFGDTLPALRVRFYSMSKHNTRAPSLHLTRKTAKESTVHLSDLVELIMEPLAGQIDRARLEMHDKIQKLEIAIENSAADILKKVQAVDDSVEILAKQKARDLQEPPARKLKS